MKTKSVLNSKCPMPVIREWRWPPLHCCAGRTRIMKTLRSSLAIAAILLSGLALCGYAAPIIGRAFPLYVVDSGAGQVWKIQADDTTALFASGFSTPRVVACAQDGNVYVGEEGGGIYRVDAAGNKSLFASIGGRVRGLAFDSGGNLYAANEAGGQVLRIDPSGQMSLFAGGLGCAQGLAFDSSGDLYVATGGYGDNRIKRIDAAGGIHDFAAVDQNPVPLCFDLNGFPGGYLLSSENQGGQPTVIKLDGSGNVSSRIAFPRGDAIAGIAIPYNGYVYVTYGPVVLKLDANLTQVAAITGFNNTFGVAASWSANPVCAVYAFDGFLPPIGGADATGGSFSAPVRTFKLGSTIPMKFVASCDGTPITTGVHRLQVIKYSDATNSAEPIDATPQDTATTGNQFRLTDGQWHFNLDTKTTGMTRGIWQVVAILSDGSQHSAWIQVK